LIARPLHSDTFAVWHPDGEAGVLTEHAGFKLEAIE